jgi:uncharacterized protein YodC (DUF2158 family)
MAEIKRGDRVQHKTGGPMMIAKDVKGTKVLCGWSGGERWYDAIELEHYREYENWESLDTDDSDFMTA